MAALRKTFLAVAAFAAVTTTVSSAFAQNQPSVPQAATCSITAVPTTIRYQGLTEYIGDIVITCLGGTPVLRGVAVPVVSFQVDLLSSTNFTSRLINTNLSAPNGGYPMNEAILAINEPVPPAGANNPSTTGLSSPYGIITQSICDDSNAFGACQNTGTGLGGYNGGSAGSSYSPANYGNYNVFQGYLHTGGSSTGSNREVRFDGIPFDPPGSVGTIEFRITNLRIDASYFAAAGNGILPVYATVSITGSQPPAVTGSTSPLVSNVTNGIIAPVPTEVLSPICGSPQNFIVPIQEGFSSSFKRRTWFADNFTSPDPTNMTGSAPGWTYSTQNVFGYQYYTESNWFNNDADGKARLINGSYTSVGLATNGTRLYVTLTGINPGVTVTAPGYAGLFGGAPLGGTLPSVYSPGGPGPSGILYLVGMSPPYAADGSGYLNTSTHATAISYTAPGPGAGSTTFVYEVLSSDGGRVETAYIDFGTAYPAGIAGPIPPYILSSSVGFAPIGVTPTVGDVPDTTPIGINAYPRFAPGPGPVQPDWYLSPCQCDLLFPHVVSNGEYETGMAIDNTSSDPYDTLRAPGYVQLFYYMDNMVKKAAGCPTCPVGNDGTRSDFQQTTTNWIAPGDQFLYILGMGSATTTGANPGTGLTTPIGTVGADPGVKGVPGFEGYIFAVTTFQYCHGYAFISSNNLGSPTFAEGYIALVVDKGRELSRGPGTPDGFGTTTLSIYSPSSVQRDEYNN